MIEDLIIKLISSIDRLTGELGQHRAIKTLEAKQEMLVGIIWEKIEDLEVSERAINCLKAAGFVYLGDILYHGAIGKDFCCLRKIINFGNKSYKETLIALAKKGIYQPVTNDEYWKERIKLGLCNFEI